MTNDHSVGVTCKCLGSVTDIPCICVERPPYDGWMGRVFERARAVAEYLPAALRSRSPLEDNSNG